MYVCMYVEQEKLTISYLFFCILVSFSFFSTRLQNRVKTMEGVVGDQSSMNRDDVSEESPDPANVVKWCEDSQARALLEEAKSEKYGITKRERKNLKKYLGYTRENKGEKKKKHYDQAGWYTRLALDLKSEGEEEEEGGGNSSGDTPFFGRLPTIFSQVGYRLLRFLRRVLGCASQAKKTPP